MQPKSQNIIKEKMPVLSSKIIKQQIKTGLNETMDRITFYYRYKIVSFAKVCKHSIYDDFIVSKISKPTIKSVKQISKDSLIQTLDKNVLIKSKYRHRDKINYRRSPVLKVMKYNFQQLRNKMGTKKFQLLYADLDDDHQQKNQEEQKKQFEVDQFFNLEAFNTYRKKRNIPPNKKIFIVHGYDDLSNYMISRGWIENPETTSLIYDFKFITKSKKIDNVNLLDHQIINHFQKSNSITTKYGLCRNIKNLVQNNIDCDKFYPRCFDLYDSLQFEDWIQDFKFTKAIAILKSAVTDVKLQDIETYQRLLLICLYVCKRYGLSVQDKLKSIEKKNYPVISLEEWKMISGEIQPNQTSLKKMRQQLNIQNIEQLKCHIQKELDRINLYDCQYNLNKTNIWIVKPASRSRGRGIKAFSDLNQILDYVIGKEQIQWVAQKYIQNPLIIKNRKFDIRQWVVLTDLKPLRIWFYDQCYIRFSAEEYNPENIKNRFAHLTNNSIAKYSQNFDNDEIKGNMFFQSQFAKVIEQRTGKNLFQDQIKKKMEKIVINSIKSATDIIVNRKNTLELYGYDFMIDQDYNPWLIQINSSPSMQYSTHVTQKLVRNALEDFGKLVCDYMDQKKNLKSAETYGQWRLIYNK